MVSKKELTEKRRRKKDDEKSDVSEHKTFLLGILNSNIEEKKKIHKYLGLLNHNIKMLKELLEEIK